MKDWKVPDGKNQEVTTKFTQQQIFTMCHYKQLEVIITEVN